jgi:hypothetical protein
MANYLIQEIERMQRRERNQTKALAKLQRKYDVVKGDLAVKNALIADMALKLRIRHNWGDMIFGMMMFLMRQRKTR